MPEADDAKITFQPRIRIESHNPYERISEVAAKVGVKPYSGRPATIVMRGADGNDYDVWEVVIAVLDRLDHK